MATPVLRYKEAFKSEDHAVGITAIAFSPLATFLAVAGLDGKVCVWYVESNRLHRTFMGETAVLSLTWLPQREDSIVIGYQDGNVAILSLKSATAIHTKGFWAHDFPIECLDIHGPLIATGAQCEVRVWRWCQDEPWHKLATLANPPTTSHNHALEILVTAVQWTPWDRRRARVLSVSYMNHGVFLYETTSWTLIHRVPVQLPIARTCFSSDGGSIAVSSLGKGFDVYDALSGAAQCTFPHDAREKYLTPVLFIHGDSGIVAGTTVGTATLWDVRSTIRIQDLPHEKDDRVLCIAAYYIAGVDRFLIATGTYGRRGQPTLKLWAATGKFAGNRLVKNAVRNVPTWIASVVVGIATIFTLFALAPTSPLGLS